MSLRCGNSSVRIKWYDIMKIIKMIKDFLWNVILSSFSLILLVGCNFAIEAFIEEGYHSTNPYHNSIHATDVTQAMHCFLQEEKVSIQLLSTKLSVFFSFPFFFLPSSSVSSLFIISSQRRNHDNLIYLRHGITDQNALNPFRNYGFLDSCGNARFGSPRC